MSRVRSFLLGAAVVGASLAVAAPAQAACGSEETLVENLYRKVTGEELIHCPPPPN